MEWIPRLKIKIKTIRIFCRLFFEKHFLQKWIICHFYYVTSVEGKGLEVGIELRFEAAPGIAVGRYQVVAMACSRVLKVKIDISDVVYVANSDANPRFLGQDVDFPLYYAVGSLE